MIDNGKVLVERRRPNDEADPGAIVLPGGHVDKGESLEQALRREMKEELGIQVEKMKFALTRTYTASNGEKQRIHYFHIEKWRGKIESRESESVYWESVVNNLHDARERKLSFGFWAEAGRSSVSPGGFAQFLRSELTGLHSQHPGWHELRSTNMSDGAIAPMMDQSHAHGQIRGISIEPP